MQGQKQSRQRIPVLATMINRDHRPRVRNQTYLIARSFWLVGIFYLLNEARHTDISDRENAHVESAD